MNKQFVSRAFVFAGCITFVFGVFQNTFFLVAAFCFMLAAGFKFPFREEEGWECSCGYDLSYLNPNSPKCPECGKDAKLEWTSSHGEYSRSTTKRLQWAVFQFILSVFVLTVYILFWMYRNSP
ncbi:MAG: hypothetical protein QF718_04735 [Phycisphaerales bacterium]|jgi:hypothetical protein|nr:hypothetical protein [Phycisphaerales bacterium]